VRGVLVYVAFFVLVSELVYWLCASELMDLCFCKFVCQLSEYPNKNEAVKSFVRRESLDP
jgi:hypothetical protein